MDAKVPCIYRHVHICNRGQWIAVWLSMARLTAAYYMHAQFNLCMEAKKKESPALPPSSGRTKYQHPLLLALSHPARQEKRGGRSKRRKMHWMGLFFSHLLIAWPPCQLGMRSSGSWLETGVNFGSMRERGIHVGLSKKKGETQTLPRGSI